MLLASTVIMKASASIRALGKADLPQVQEEVEAYNADDGNSQ